MKYSLYFPFWVFIFLALFACSDEQDMDIPKPIDELQKKIAEVVPEQNQTILKDLGINFNSGTNPPTIAGIFRISPKTLQATTVQGGNQSGHVFPDAGIRFFDQTLENIKVQGVNFIGEEFLSQNAIIVGTSNNFTVFAKGTATKGSNSAIFDVIITGVKDGNTIRNLKAAYTNINNANGGGQFIPQGTAELIYDSGSNSEAVSSLDEVLETDPDPDENGEDPDPGESYLYVVGYQRQRSSNLNLATLWHNDQVQILESENQSTIATGITAMGEDLIISGTQRPTNTSPQTAAVYWKNGNLNKLANEVSEANAVLVQGNDLYFAGTINRKAAYWKNGVLQELPTRGNISVANNIFVDDEKVYVVGNEVFSGKNIGVLWTNGEPTYLSENSRSVDLTGVTVIGEDVYVVGTENPSSTQTGSTFARYWKNGDAHWLQEGPTNSWARDIKEHNGQVYMVFDVVEGFGNNTVYYHKNGENIKMSTGDKPANCHAVALKGNNIYGAGHISYVAAYFKNDTEVVLPKSEPTSDYAQTGAYGIYIKN